jgi:hypothetical protein
LTTFDIYIIHVKYFMLGPLLWNVVLTLLPATASNGPMSITTKNYF